MMLDTVLSFGGSAYPQIDAGWFGDPLRSIVRLPGQLMGLGMTAEEARRILSVGTYGGTYTQAQVDEAHGVYYGTATTPGAYQAATGGQTGGSNCPPMPEYPDSTVMSTPTCQPMDFDCQRLAGQIEVYNLAVIAKANAFYQRAVCVHNECLNGRDGSVCATRHPTPAVPSQPIYPDARAILSRNGAVAGYSNQPIGTVNNAGSATVTGAVVVTQSTADETAAARKIYTDLIAQAGASSNSAVTALLDRDFAAGVTWYKSTHNNSTSGLVAYIQPRAYDTVQGWLRAAGVLKADGTVNNTNTGGGSGSSGGAGGNADTGDKKEEDKSTTSDSQGGMFIVLGAVALLMLAGKGR